MANKTTPIITHTEIITRAIHSIEEEIGKWRSQCEGLPQDMREQMFTASTKDLAVKLTALKSLYLIETGTEYV